MKHIRIGLFMLIFLFLISSQSSAEKNIWTLNFDPLEYEGVTTVFEAENWKGKEEQPNVKVDGVQVVKSGEYIGDEVVRNDLEESTFVTLKVQITANEEPLTINSFLLRTASGLNSYDVIEKHSSLDDTNNEVKPGETKELILTFAAEALKINPEGQNMLILHSGIYGENEDNGPILIPLTEEGANGEYLPLQGVYKDKIKDNSIFQKNTLMHEEIEEQKKMEGIAEVKLAGYEAALLEESNLHTAKDFVISDVEPGMISLTFRIEFTSLTDGVHSYLLNPELVMNNQSYRHISQFGSYPYFTLDQENQQGHAFVVFAVEEDAWENADRFKLNLGPVYNDRLNPIPASELSFQIRKESN